MQRISSVVRPRINRKIACKTVTPENFSSKLCTRDYVRDDNHCANFGAGRSSGGFFLSRWTTTPWWLFWLFSVFCPIFFTRVRSPVEPLDDFHAQTTCFRARCLLGVRTIDDVIWGNMLQNPLKVGANRFQGKMPKYKKSHYLQNCKSDQTEIWGWSRDHHLHFVGGQWATITLNQIQHGWRPPSWKSLWRHDCATDDPIPMKCGMPMLVKRSKLKTEVEVQYGVRLFSETGRNNFSAMDWDRNSMCR